jgi:hypothetical protein
LLSSDGSERSLVWSACGFDFRRELFARGGALVPVGANAQRGPGAGGRVLARPRRKGERSRQEQFRA